MEAAWRLCLVGLCLAGLPVAGGHTHFSETQAALLRSEVSFFNNVLDPKSTCSTQGPCTCKTEKAGAACLPSGTVGTIDWLTLETSDNCTAALHAMKACYESVNQWDAFLRQMSPEQEQWTKDSVSLLTAAKKKKGDEPTCTVMKNVLNSQYTLPVSVGTPPQEIQMLPATGTGEILLASHRCKTCRADKPRFDRLLSKTYESKKTRFAYADAFTANKGRDVVALGGFSTKRQSVLELTSEDLGGFDAQGTYNGVVGLARSTNIRLFKNDSDTTLLEGLNVKVYAMCFGRGDLSDGILTVGGAATLDYSDFTVSGNMQWGHQMQLVTVGSGKVCSTGCGVILDPGSSMIAGPMELLEVLADALADLKEDCSNVKDMPDMEVDLGGAAFTIKANSFIYNVSAGDAQGDPGFLVLPRYAKAWATKKQPWMCIPAFSPIDRKSTQGPVWILGVPFMRNFYTKWDREAKTVSLADPAGVVCSNCDGQADPQWFDGPLSVQVDALATTDWALAVPPGVGDGRELTPPGEKPPDPEADAPMVKLTEDRSALVF